MTIAELIAEAAACSKEKGFFDQPLNVGEQLMLIVGEASEAMEDYRNHETPDGLKDLGFELKDMAFWSDDGGGPYGAQKTPEEVEQELKDWVSDGTELSPQSEAEIRRLYKPCGFPSELADIVIRVATLSARMDIDLEAAIRDKMQYNRTRAHLHGGKKV